ncbi:Invasion protein IalB, involved in pathogenesis [Bradyrhizobium brasilense]|uniref:Invasion protein IalB, involved in pathogenesis n=1 Tax=Bradyrhizobium brasilense TaxID=1419277 RepID=A0A1G7NLP3_9BRAD|nr:invasion associated locus B family protein [Bradyrhizobium brasilense]SDF74978.1 Invasion protein IalB, involved in pathogenesis [Bradyrhizobium brasilense]
MSTILRPLIVIGVLTAMAGSPAVMAGEMTPWAQPAGTAATLSSIAMSPPTPAATSASAAASLGFEWASAFEPGKAVGVGDYTRTVRPFLDWTQICDVVRGGRPICYLETIARQDGAAVAWRIALAKDGRSMSLVILPADASQTAGVTVGFGGMSRPVKPLVCDRAVCVGTFPVDAAIISLLAREERATVSFEREGKPITISASLRGMGLALFDLMPKAVAQRDASRSPANTQPKRLATAPAKTAPSSPWEGLR